MALSLIVPMLVLDGLSSVVLFFLSGMYHEATFLSQDALHYAWDTSLIDAFCISVLKTCILLYIWIYTKRLAVSTFKSDFIHDASESTISKCPTTLRLLAVALPIASMVFFIAKGVYLEVDRDKTSSSIEGAAMAWTLVQICIFTSAAFSLLEAGFGFGLAKLFRQTQALKIAEMTKRDSTSNDKDDNDDEDDESKEDKKANFRRLIRLVYPEWVLLLLGTLCLFVSSAATILTPLFFGRVIDAAVSPDDPTGKLNKQIIILALIFLGGSIFTLLRSYLFTLAGQRLVARVRKDVFAAIVRQDIAFFDKNRTGELTNRLASDTAVIQNALTVNVSMLFRYIIQIVGSLAIMFSLSWKLTLVLLSVVPPVAIGAVWYGKRVKKLRKKFQDELAVASALAEEVLSSMRTVRSFSNEKLATDHYDKDIEKSYQVGKKLAFINAGFAGVTSLLAQAAITLMLWYGATLVIKGTLSSGLLSGFMLYTLQVAAAFAFLSSLYGDFMQAVGASTRIFTLMDREPEVSFKGGIKPNSFESSISFNDVVFRYPSRKDTIVLNNVTFQVQPGKVVALVGPSGGGKSTIVAMLERFYTPENGVLTVSGHDVSQLDPEWLHQHIALVGQEPVLFAMTIGENISYGKATATQEEIEAAARMANAHDFISSFEDGYDTKVGERGVRLSGGQKQRIAIARALLMDPEILLLDEATSALDAESEHLVQNAIDNAMKGRTVLVIAHRLSTVRDADEIIVMNKGQIAEQGHHDDLIARKGIYHKLVQRQLEVGQLGSPSSEDLEVDSDDEDLEEAREEIGHEIEKDEDEEAATDTL